LLLESRRRQNFLSGESMTYFSDIITGIYPPAWVGKWVNPSDNITDICHVLATEQQKLNKQVSFVQKDWKFSSFWRQSLSEILSHVYAYAD
jgi:hypothetical protein